jgi:uncharacterized protein YkwD/uncharacterized protein YraI
MRHGICCAILAVAAVVGFGRAAVAAPGSAEHQSRGGAIATSDYCADGEALAFLDLINEYRSENGVEPLALSQTLGAAAEHHSLDMAANDAYNPFHTLSDGSSAFDNIAAHGYPADATIGENIAAGPDDAAEAFALWQASPPHNENMLNPAYRAIGIGRAYGPNASYDWFWTTTFGGELDVPATICGGASASTGSPAVTTTDVNFRAGPSLDAEVLDVLLPGTEVTRTGEESDGFAAVRFDGRDGWIWAEYLADGEATPAVEAGTTLTTMTRLNLRAGPSLGDEVLTVMPAGAAVTATGEAENGFFAVEFDGQRGWAHSAYLV